jgi:hypothetical protein
VEAFSLFMYPDLMETLNRPGKGDFRDRVILATKNNQVDKINALLAEKIVGVKST